MEATLSEHFIFDRILQGYPLTLKRAEILILIKSISQLRERVIEILGAKAV